MNMVTDSYIESLLRNSEIKKQTIDGTCVVVVVLPSKYVMTESCPVLGNKEAAFEYLMSSIKDRLKELEGYRFQCELSVG